MPIVLTAGLLVGGVESVSADADPARTSPDSASAQPMPEAKASSDISAESDPTRPVLFSIRDEYRDLKGESWANTLILRVDRLTLKNLHTPGSAKGLILRADVPLNTVHFGPSTTTGLGDVYPQALYIPRISRKFAVAVGSGLVIPTASDDVLGMGKWIAAPVAAPVWFFPGRGLSYIKIQDYVSFAGASDRAEVHFLSVVPTLILRVDSPWWTQLDSETRIDWTTDHASEISGVQIGRMLRGKFGAWVRAEFPWGYYRQGDWTIKAVVFHVR